MSDNLIAEARRHAEALIRGDEIGDAPQSSESAARTNEQIVAEAMVGAGAPLMHSRVEEAVVAALREAGRLAAARAAQGAAPQVIVCDYCGDALPSVASRAHIPTTPSIQRLGFSADKVVCPECVQRARGAAPVLPSSVVDEDKLAEVIAKSRGFGNGWEQIPPLTREAYREVARAVAEWLEGQGNAARE